MSDARRGLVICLFFLALLVARASSACGNGYPGFSFLDANDCVPLDRKAVLQLPVEWHKYADFTKICGLNQKKGQPAKVSIISIWADDYYETRPSDAVWEKFPPPLIVDQARQRMGQLPELYPTHQASELRVYYGKWQSGMPAEIRIDVYSPAVEGDYYFAPMIWNKDKGFYEMRSKKRMYGIRPR
jgi:hypothetical protein